MRRHHLDAPGCGRPGLIRRMLDRLRRRERFDCGDWLDEPPPDSFVREPRRPRPSAPSRTVALELPLDLE